MSHLAETCLSGLKFTREATKGFLSGFEGDQWFKPFGQDGGHAAYIVGHIASTDDMTLRMLAGRSPMLSETEQKFFGGDASPSEQAPDYPPPAELMQKMESAREMLLEYFGGLSNDELLAPVEGPMAEFGANRAQLMVSLAWHEGMHAGQLTVIRRQLGMPRVFG